MQLVRSNPAGPTTLDDLFVLKYEWLMRWALHFAQGDRSTAEDLVQDTFVRFAMTHPELDDSANAEALLYTYLKHVHLSHIRRLQRYPFQNLSIDEFDTISLGLRQNPSANPAEVQDDLRQVLAYLCWRKGSTKSASILILRFFYGYFPEEIARIGLVSRPLVDNGLRSARKELKCHLQESCKAGVLRFDGAPKVNPATEALPTEQFIEELRETLISWRRGACLPADQLVKRYLAESSRPIECELLAHIVSCQRCLDLVANSRQIPSLGERSFDRALVERHNSKPPRRAIAFARDSSLKRSLAAVHGRIREISEHELHSLTLVVNGHSVATQDISSAACKQDVEINIGAPIEIIEVYSDQGLCLLAMPVSSAPPEAPPEVYSQVKLSCGRTVEAWLRFHSAGPRIETSYRDPSLLDPAHGAAGLDDAGISPWRGFLSSITLSEQEPQTRLSRLSKLWGRFKDVALPDMTPILAAGLVLLTASLLCFAVWWNEKPHVTTSALLERAEAADAQTHRSPTPGVVFQNIRIKTPQRTVNRAIYRDAQGVRRPRQKVLAAADAQLKASLAGAGVDWEEPLSASMYRNWHDRQHIRQDVITHEGEHLLKLTTTVSDGPIAEESLTVRDSDFRPVARTVQLHDAGSIEIAELSYEVLPWSATGEDWFEPLGTSSAGASIPHSLAHLPHMPHLPSQIELDEAELETRLVLHQLGADTSERIEIDRATNAVQVKGIVATSGRKQEIESRLRLVPHVVSAIYTFQELDERRNSANEVTSIRQATSAAAPSPLETYLLDRGMSRTRIGELGIDLSNASITVSQEGKAIEELLGQFGRSKQLTPAARSAFDQLLTDHREKLLSSLRSEEQLLTQAGIMSDPSSRDVADGQLQLALDRHRALCSELLAGNALDPRSARRIALDLEQSLQRLRAITTGLASPSNATSLLSSPPQTNENN